MCFFLLVHVFVLELGDKIYTVLGGGISVGDDGRFVGGSHEESPDNKPSEFGDRKGFY